VTVSESPQPSASSRIKRPATGGSIGGTGGFTPGGPESEAAGGPRRPRAVPIPPDIFDIALYAPIGFLTRIKSLLPELVQTGKSQVALAKLVGTMAARRVGGHNGGRSSVEATAEVTVPVTETSQPTSKPGSAASHDKVPLGAKKSAVRTKKATSNSEPAVKSETTGTKSVAAKKSVAKKRLARSIVEFPISGYDTLPASSVVALLGALSVPELDIVRVYELNNRRRRTILTRIAQLSPTT
jgi:hypothetical protein